MKKEIIVNADDLESRVAILEDGKLAELHVEREARIVGSIFKGRIVSVLRGMDASFADVGLDRNVFLCADDVGYVSQDGVTVTPAPRSASITQRLKEKQEVVMQIVRAPVAGKGARATTRLALPGRYLVLLLSHGTQVGVSRKIEDRKERERLRKIGERIRPKDTGLIIRTEAENRGPKDLEADLEVLLDLRDRLMKKAAQTKAPALLHQDLTLTYQVIRDVFTDDIGRLVIDEKSVYDTAVELVKLIAPKLRKRVKLHRGRLPIFHKYGIEGEIDRLLRRRVWLGAGGYISIDQAEAFTAIDVNTGRYTGSTGLEETIFRTNMEAAQEIARQLRLRDLGGIIVIDFIDMERARHRNRVMKAFEAALKRDRQRTKILHLSPLGLVEMTRKRRGESLMGILTETCPHCAGLGRVRRPLTIALKLEREAYRLASEDKPKAVIVRAAGSVADLLIGDRGARAAALEKRAGTAVYIRGDQSLPIEEHEVLPTSRAGAEKLISTWNRGDEPTLDRVDPPQPGNEQETYAWVDGYRVLVDSGGPVDVGSVIVLTEAGRSFGRGHVKGARRAARPDKAARSKAASTRKRRRPRRKSKATGASGSVSSQKASKGSAPHAKAAGPDEPEATRSREHGADVKVAKGADTAPGQAGAKRRGLLRRGARRLARTLRESA